MKSLRDLAYAIQPDGRYFVFDLASGATLWRNLPTAQAARVKWILLCAAPIGAVV